jgi:hypothetical protein
MTQATRVVSTCDFCGAYGEDVSGSHISGVGTFDWCGICRDHYTHAIVKPTDQQLETRLRAEGWVPVNERPDEEDALTEMTASRDDYMQRELVAREERDQLQKRVEALETRRDELLATVAKVSRETPYPDELKNWEAQRGTMMALIMTLRHAGAAAVAAMRSYTHDTVLVPFSAMHAIERALMPDRGKELYDAIQIRLIKGHNDTCSSELTKCPSCSSPGPDSPCTCHPCDCGHEALRRALNLN